MKKRTLLIALLIISIVATSLSAGGTSESKADKKTVTYWSMWNEAEPQGLVLAQAAEAFENETGIFIDIVFNGREIRKTLAPALEAGETIDMFDEDITRVNSNWGKFLLPLEEKVKQTYPTTGGKSFADSVSKALLDLARQEGNGTLKVIPYQPFAFVVMYNQDLFDKAGITATPTTWKEFEVAAAKLISVGVTPITVDDAYMAAFFGYNMSRLIGVEKTLAMANNNDFSDPAVKEFGRIWSDAAKKGWISKKAASNIYPSGQIEEVASGKVAMYLNGTWLPNEIKGNAPNMNWGSFAWPSMSPNGAGTEANNYGAQCFGINNKSTVADEAFQFAVYMTTGKWDSELAKQSLGVPMGSTSDWPKQTAGAKKVIDNTTTWMTWAAGMENSADVNSKIKENFAKLITGSLDADSFYAAMNK
ncbi:MAG: carbohydrate ABC transporter substrate-binding protein [Spirochaetia bacterium]|nr:carbohydrate ABC transporter substrate-binding protein [Spirochaetia bacterium]